MLKFAEKIENSPEEKLQKLIGENDHLKFINANLKQLVKQLQLQLFGASKDHLLSKELFNETEEIHEKEDIAEPEEPTEVKPHNRKKPKRKPIPEIFPRKEIIHDLNQEEKFCACCSLELKKIGEEISEKLDIIPAQIIVEKHIRYKYACKACEGNVKLAPIVGQFLPKSNATPGLLAHIIVSKYQDALPLYRQESIFKRIGIDISRGVMASWVIKTANMLMPIFNLMKEDLISSPVINCDETRIRVLNKNGMKIDRNSFMWVMASWQPHRKIVIFEHEPTRSGEAANRLLNGFSGYLQADGYDAYNSVVNGAIRVGCFAHVRRKYVDSINSLDIKYRKNHSGNKAIAYIKQLYQIEEKFESLPLHERKIKREKEVKPIFEEFRKWLDIELVAVPPKTAYGRALNYAHNEWPYLIRYIEHELLTPDNNRAENAIRPFVIGRNNWLFSDTTNGADASAVLYSIIETAKANGLEPYFYLRHILKHLPIATTVEDFEDLLPYKEIVKSSVNLSKVDLQN